MKKARKALLTLCAALLLVSVTAGMTIAYLTDSATVTNTFTVGDGIGISLFETPVWTKAHAEAEECTSAQVGKKIEDEEKTAVRNEYNLVPGYEYDKDPTVFVDANSGDCYVFVTVANGIAAIEDDSADTIAEQMENNGWLNVTGNVWVKVDGENNQVCKAGDELVVFENFTTEDTLSEISAEMGEAEIVVTAYAVQIDGFESNTAAEIWNTVFASSVTTGA